MIAENGKNPELDNEMKLINDKQNAIVISKGPTFGMRHVQGLFIFLNSTLLFINRVDIGIAVVAMTNAATTNTDFREFDWNEKEISYILSSFFWGCLCTQFVGGVMCRRFGTKATMGTATFGLMSLIAVTPCLVTWGGWQVFCIIRFVLGLLQGVMFPCYMQHLAKWSPLEERNRLCVFSLSGIDFGVVMALVLTGLIAKGPLGWPGISYVSAGLCLLWCILWFFFGANNATESRFISRDEKTYIETSLSHDENFHAKNIPIPWKAIVTSVPFFALVMTRCSGGWGLTTIQSQIPAYFHGVLGMEIKSNALFSSLPFVVTWLLSYGLAITADILQNKRLLSPWTVRKVFNSLGFWLPAAGLIAMCFLNKNDKTFAVLLLTVSVGANGCATIGSGLNIIDLSPNHAGILIGFVASSVNIMALISPLVVGVIVTDTSNHLQWQMVFAISAGIFFLGNLIYIILGTSDVQPWDAEDFLPPKDMESSKCTAKNVKCNTAALDNT